jgi:hypothetical protein
MLLSSRPCRVNQHLPSRACRAEKSILSDRPGRQVSKEATRMRFAVSVCVRTTICGSVTFIWSVCPDRSRDYCATVAVALGATQRRDVLCRPGWPFSARVVESGRVERQVSSRVAENAASKNLKGEMQGSNAKNLWSYCWTPFFQAVTGLTINPSVYSACEQACCCCCWCCCCW